METHSSQQQVPPLQERVLDRLSKEFDSNREHIGTLLARLDEGYRIPYLARFRVEEYPGATEERLLEIAHRAEDVRMLEERRTHILEELGKQGNLNEELRARLLASQDISDLEKIFRPYRPKSRATAADLAREAGMGPLAMALEHRSLEAGKTPLESAADYVDASRGIETAQQALDGAKAILIEKIRQDSELLERLRPPTLKVTPKHAGRGVPREFRPYAKYEKSCHSIAWPDFLNIRKGQRENHLEVHLSLTEEKAHQILADRYAKDLEASDPLRNFYDSMLREAWHQVLKPTCEQAFTRELKEDADRAALRSYAKEYRALLMAPAAGRVKVCGILPAIRKATRCTVVDEKGAIIAHQSLHPLRTEHRDTARQNLLQLLQEHGIRILALGGGPGCREIEAFLMEAVADMPERPQILIVDEAGTMGLARKELSRLDLSTRKAAIVARRLQDPLNEWARLEPESIHLGPAQEEVHQGHLKKALEDVRESCLHSVGLDLATCFEETLSHISGMDRMKAAKTLSAYRGGKLESLRSLVDLTILNEIEFEQSAGFLRLEGSKEALDATRIEPRRYDLVEAMAASIGLSKAQLLERREEIDKIQLAPFEKEDVSRGTLKWMLDELRGLIKDPRPEFEYVEFDPAYRKLEDLEMGQEVRGRILRIADFGAFVDIGVAPGGLLHVSQMSDHYVGNPHRLFQHGQILRLRVLEVDKKEGRLSLTLRSGEIQKVHRTLGDFASGKRKPGAIVIGRGQEADAGHSRSRFAERQGGGGHRGQQGGGRSGPGGGRPGGGRPGGGRTGGGSDRGRPGGGRPGGGGRRDDDRRGPGGRDRGGSQRNYVTESEDLKESIAADRGEKGELKSFSALAGLLGKSSSEPAKDSGKKKSSKKQGAKDKTPSPTSTSASEQKAPEQKGPESQPDNAEVGNQNVPDHSTAGSPTAPSGTETNIPTPADLPPQRGESGSGAPAREKPALEKLEEKEKFGEDFV